MKEKMAMDNDVMNRIFELQNIIKEDFGTLISFEDILMFLEDAMNFGGFQVKLLEYKLDGVKLSYSEKIRLFLSENDNEDILRLYGIINNFNDVNIESIEERLFDDSRENGPVKVKVSDKNREVLARIILR